MRAPALSLILALVVGGCGGSGTAQHQPKALSANGTWLTTLATPASGPTPPTFSFSMTGGTGSMMNISNMQMINTTGCFGAGSVMTSTAPISGGMMSGGMMGPGTQIVMDLWSDAAHTGNHLNMVMVMTGTMDGMTGTYTLMGVTPGCLSGSGTISMGRH